MQRNTKFFKQIIVLFLLISMSSCKLTEQMAKRQIGRIMVEFPSVLALPCATMFPPIVSEKERIKIVKGDTVINTDTVIVDCADEKNIGQKIKIEKVEKVILNFGLPSTSSLFLNLSLQAKREVDAINIDECFDKHPNNQGIYPDDHKLLFDFFELMIAQIVFSFSAI